MRCPKCQYLGFEPSPRCKNCGYDFSFDNNDLPSLTIVPEPDGHDALRDFDLQVLDDGASPPSAAAASVGFDLDDLLARGRSGVDRPPTPAPAQEPEPVARRAAASTAAAVMTPAAEEVVRIVRDAPARVPAPAPVTTELPLFMQVMSDVAETPPVAPAPAAVPAARTRVGVPLTIEAATAVDQAAAEVPEDVDDRPLVRVPTVLRPPLAVRRTTPDPARLRAKYARAAAKAEASGAGDLLRGIDDADANVRPPQDPAGSRLSAEPTPESLPAGWLQGVGAGKRLSAAAIDGLLLGLLNAAIVWFTLSVCGMGPSDAHLLPLLPIALFFLLVDGGYMVLFTAACGQTIGKMAAGIRVVGTNTGAIINDRITVGQAVARALGAIASCIPLGAGLWMSLVGDGRALHDRIAHTRVVRA